MKDCGTGVSVSVGTSEHDGGALTVLLSILAVDFALTSPAYTFSLPSNEILVNSIFFAIVALSIVWLAHLQRSMLGRIYKKREITELLMKELQHRSKNYLSVIQAIIVHSLQNHPDKAQLISGRIKTISEADNALTQSTESQLGRISSFGAQPIRARCEDQGTSCDGRSDVGASLGARPP
jgi:K+-sensing histidine kinase KdpD